MTTRKTDPKFVRAYERAMLRSQFVSLFWAIFSDRKKQSGLKLRDLADALGKNKGEVSRWFSSDPNWTLNTVANLAHALDVELKIEAVDRTSGVIFTPSGVFDAAGEEENIHRATVSATSASQSNEPVADVVHLVQHGSVSAFDLTTLAA